MGIKAVVFDFGKVISFPQETSVMEELAVLAGLEVKIIDDLVWKYRSEYDRGTISGKKYYRTLLRSGGVSVDDSTLERMLWIDLNSWTRINPETQVLMEGIKKAGYKLGILSNMPHDFFGHGPSSFPGLYLS